MRTTKYDTISLPLLRAEGGLRAWGANHRGAQRPLVTVLTVVFNGAAGIEDTIRSVIRERVDAIEYIVVDGGSTDGSVEILQRYDAEIDYWLSERDAGVYDAMNKGRALARGNFIYHLNVGDELVHMPLAELARADAKGADAISFAVERSDGVIHRPEIGWKLRLTNTLHHQGTFYRTDLPLDYDTRFGVFADFDLNQRLWRAGGMILIDPQIVARHRADGLSHDKRHFAEVFSIVRKNFGISHVALAYLSFRARGLVAWLSKASS